MLEVPADRTIAPEPLPEGYTIRDFVPGADDEAAFRLVDDAFNEWPDRQPSTLDDWAARAIRRPGFEPWQLRMVEDDSGTAVGVAYTIVTGDCGYVDQLAVRRDQRGQGLARSLLVDAFQRARERGAARSELSTDSRTGRSGCTSTSAWWSRRPGGTGRPTSEARGEAQSQRRLSSSSAIWTALRAAPLRRLSPTTNITRPLPSGADWSTRTRPT